MDLSDPAVHGFAQRMLEAIPAAACVVDAEMVVVAANQAWQDLLVDLPGGKGEGTEYPDLLRRAVGDESHNADEILAGLREVLAGDAETFDLDYPCALTAGRRWMRARVTALPELGGAVISHADLTAYGLQLDTVADRALFDPLTSLPNRQLLLDRLTQALGWAARVDQQVALALLDLDGFKRVNDIWGQAAGDELLRATGARLEQLVSGTDTVARYADDGFAVLRPGVTGLADGEEFVTELMSAFEEPFTLPGADGPVRATAAAGLNVGAPPASGEELMRGADLALLTAQREGRGRVITYTEQLGQGAQTRSRTEYELHDGIEAGEFALFYQPVVDLKARKVVGVEALLRWCHPDGIRLPDTFIPIAEESGLIVPLGGWVVAEACRQAVAWARQGLQLDIAVNLSARQVSQVETISTVERALRETRLDPRRLLVEVTESAVVEDADQAQRALDALSALGVRVAIDDFGTGYSSLLYLKRYPIQALKVDRSFVSGIGGSDDDDAIVASVISLSRAVGAVCIAEGVETDEQQASLLALGCQYAQGFLFGRPSPAEDVPALVESCNARLQLPPPAGRGRSRRTPRVQPAVVARIEQLHGEGASLHTIAAVLNREHAPTDHGGRWVSATVARVIAARRAGQA